MARAYQKAFDEAKKANLDRYNEIKKGFEARRMRALNFLEGSGRQEAKDIAEQFRKTEARAQADLVDRGLAGTSVLGNVKMGATRGRVAAMGRLQERLNQQRLNVDARLSGDKLAFMERREDPFPDFNQLERLSVGEGMAQGGGRSRALAGPAGFTGFNRAYFPGAGSIAAANRDPRAGAAAPGGAVVAPKSAVTGPSSRRIRRTRQPSVRRRSRSFSGGVRAPGGALVG